MLFFPTAVFMIMKIEDAEGLSRSGGIGTSDCAPHGVGAVDTQQHEARATSASACLWAIGSLAVWRDLRHRAAVDTHNPEVVLLISSGAFEKLPAFSKDLDGAGTTEILQKRCIAPPPLPPAPTSALSSARSCRRSRRCARAILGKRRWGVNNTLGCLDCPTSAHDAREGIDVSQMWHAMDRLPLSQAWQAPG
jgi:hypothetical protein